MKYAGTRGNFRRVEAAEAINFGMVPSGGLFVPESIPEIDISRLKNQSYQETAYAVLSHFLTDYTDEELRSCITRAYSTDSFDTPDIVNIVKLGKSNSILELWHGPTAAFKDMALQIMPHFLSTAKNKLGVNKETLILVATSGDTGKAALEGFKNINGISIVVYYPAGGVSEIQRLQMATTEGSNTYVYAVDGNFDDCQTGVKSLFGDEAFRWELAEKNIDLSSANSINWGRLCPQIVYYFYGYMKLVEQGDIVLGEEIDICVPTGNFGNILSAYYAERMGLPVGTLICASNRNRVLADFLKTGVYDRNRPFYKTTSPSMDILISSNLERFLYEITDHSSEMVCSWFADLSEKGAFRIEPDVKSRLDSIMTGVWLDDEDVFKTIEATYEDFGYVLDTHTAVGVGAKSLVGGSRHTLIDSTASPYKFSPTVLEAICGERYEDEFETMERLETLTSVPVHRAVAGLREKPVRHSRKIGIGDMKRSIRDILF